MIWGLAAMDLQQIFVNEQKAGLARGRWEGKEQGLLKDLGPLSTFPVSNQVGQYQPAGLSLSFGSKLKRQGGVGG